MNLRVPSMSHGLPACGRPTTVRPSTVSTYNMNNEVFRFWACSTEGLPPNVVSAVRKYKLNYSVRVAAPNESEPWLSENGAILFKFWATDFEELTCFTGNNPRVR